MRTTLTLDDDVVVLLKRARRRRNAKLREIVNQALREGLARLERPTRRDEPFRTRAVSLGRCKMASLDDVAEALAVAEGEAFR